MKSLMVVLALTVIMLSAFHVETVEPERKLKAFDLVCLPAQKKLGASVPLAAKLCEDIKLELNRRTR